MTPGLRHECWPCADLADLPAEWWQGVLGVVGYAEAPALRAPGVPLAVTTTPQLGGAPALCEVWRTDEAPGLPLLCDAGSGWQLQYRGVGSWLFGAVTVAEDDPALGLEGAVRHAYAKIFDTLRLSGHASLVRVWHYLPSINRQDGGYERYRAFNTARRAAFEAGGRATAGEVPAACALGSDAAGVITIHFLAARAPPAAIENPRQRSAYHYPPRYGRHTPVFSRATLTPGEGGMRLFVSGTASIVGHETVHAGDVAAQTDEALANIHAVLEAANRRLGERRYALDDLHFRVYVRHVADLTTVAARCAQVLAAAVPVVYLRADVCREDLLVEIEAVG